MANELRRRGDVIPGAERHGFEYVRYGTLPLYAVLNTDTGEVIGTTAARHTSA